MEIGDRTGDLAVGSTRYLEVEVVRMDHDEFFMRFLASQQYVSPHAAAYNRRQFLRRALQLGFGASALAFLAACGSSVKTRRPAASGGGSG